MEPLHFLQKANNGVQEQVSTAAQPRQPGGAAARQPTPAVAVQARGTAGPLRSRLHNLAMLQSADSLCSEKAEEAAAMRSVPTNTPKHNQASGSRKLGRHLLLPPFVEV